MSATYELEIISTSAVGGFHTQCFDADKFEIKEGMIAFFINTAPRAEMFSFSLLCAYGPGMWRKFTPTRVPKRFDDTPQDAPLVETVDFMGYPIDKEKYRPGAKLL